MSKAHWRTARVSLLLLGVAVAGCSSSGRSGDGTTPQPRAARRTSPPPPPDPVQTFRRMGLIAHGGQFPLTGRVSYLATGSSDSTFMLLTLALPSRALTFSHTGEQYRAEYAVDGTVIQGGYSAARVQAQETVIVPNFRETTRTDESVVFQQVLRLAPGEYSMTLHVRDVGSDRAVLDTVPLSVPRLVAGGVSTPVPYYEAVVRPARDSTPRILVTPRATVTFGRDSLLPIYLEGYGTSDEPLSVHASVRGEMGGDVWRDTLTLVARRGGVASTVLSLPVTRLGIGASTLHVWPAGRADTMRTPLFVSFGDDLPAASFEDMLSYLRFFTSPARLQRLRGTPVEQRGAAWAAFLRDTDPDPTLEGHQGLQRYFTRIAVANQRYREDMSVGWLSDRGMVFVAFGDPDQIYEPNPMAVQQRNRQQIWVYREQGLQLEFRDVTGFDRWQLTPNAEAQFRGALQRLHGG